jgi:hypothetical protein
MYNSICQRIRLQLKSIHIRYTLFQPPIQQRIKSNLNSRFVTGQNIYIFFEVLITPLRFRQRVILLSMIQGHSVSTSLCADFEGPPTYACTTVRYKSTSGDKLAKTAELYSVILVGIHSTTHCERQDDENVITAISCLQ